LAGYRLSMPVREAVSPSPDRTRPTEGRGVQYLGEQDFVRGATPLRTLGSPDGRRRLGIGAGAHIDRVAVEVRSLTRTDAGHGRAPFEAVCRAPQEIFELLSANAQKSGDLRVVDVAVGLPPDPVVRLLD